MQFPRPLTILVLGLLAVTVSILNYPRMVLARRRASEMDKAMWSNVIKRVK